jgi:hypothetical protein
MLRVGLSRLASYPPFDLAAFLDAGCTWLTMRAGGDLLGWILFGIRILEGFAPASPAGLG